MEDKIFCPMVDRDIDEGDCVVNSDITAGLFKEGCLSEEFKQKENWREICKSCKWHNY